MSKKRKITSILLTGLLAGTLIGGLSSCTIGGNGGDDPTVEPVAQKYKITFHAGSETKEREYDSGFKITSEESIKNFFDGKYPTVANSTFEGWYTDQAYTNKVTFPFEVTENTNLYAKYTLNTVTVKFDTNGGNTIANVTVNAGGTVSKPTNPTKDGYTFAGWYSDSALKNAYDFSTKVNSTITLYAKWTAVEVTPVTYTVTFNSNGGSTVASKTVNADSAVAKPTDPTKTGYTFEGWYTDTACTQAFTFTTAITANTTLYAKWTEVEVVPVTYTVTFDSNGGSSVTAATVTSGSKVTKPTDPTKDGYTFEGWYIGDTAFDFTNTTITENKTLTAKWNEVEVTPTTYTVTFDSNGGDEVTAQTINENGTATEPTDPTKDGYNFGGWFTDENCTQEYNFSTTVTGNITLYAKWNEPQFTQYTVTFNSNGGSDVTAQTINENGTATEPTAPTKDGYDFGGWYSDSELQNEFNFTTAITANTTLYAKWNEIEVTPTSYTITFDSNGGSSVTAQTIDENGTATEPTNPTRDGYDFGGWYSDSALQNEFNFTTAITASITLYAKWTENTPTPSTVKKTYVYNLGTSATVGDVTKTFTGNIQGTTSTWECFTVNASATDSKLEKRSSDSQFNTGAIISFTAAYDGKFIITSYPNYHYFTVNGTAATADTTTIDITKNQTITVEATNTAYLYEMVIEYNEPSEGGQQQATQYTVSFNTNGGSSITPQTVNENGTATQPTDPTKDGYTFGGWYSDSACTQEFSFSTAITANKTLYAKWDAVPVTQYTVTFNSNGGSSVTAQTIDENGTATQPTNPTKNGYEFVGWFTDENCTQAFNFNTAITESITLYAGYQAEQASNITISAYSGYTEGAYLELPTGKTYTVEYQKLGATSYTTVDSNLIRTLTDKVRVDILGLSAGQYTIMVTSGSDKKTVSVNVAADDRSGYAHFGATTGIGAYNNDGTLKTNAQVIYVTEENKNTVSLNGKTGISAILQNQRYNTKPLVVRIVGTVGAAVWNQLEYDPDGTYKVSKNMPITEVKDKNGNQIPAGNYTEEQIIANGYNTLNTSTYSKLNGLTNKIKKDSDTELDSYYNMLDISNANNVTIEGVGTDATIDSWGFTWKNCSYIEVKNITFQNNPEDACSFEGSDTGASSLSELSTGWIWLHNNTFKKGVNPWDVCKEQDKHDGDGATDFKGLRNVTVSYNRYIENHKTGLVGGSGTHATANVTFHHNWYDGNQARLPYGRQANMHMYNNYYDSSTGTNMQIYDGGYAFIENCYFKDTSKTFEVKKDKTTLAPAIKLWNCYFNDNCSNTTGTYITKATSRTQDVTSDCRFGQNFDTNSSIFYYNSTTKQSNVTVMTATSDVPAYLATHAGAGKMAYNTEVSTPVATYTVTFNSNGGSEVAAQTIAEGNVATTPTAPTKSGYTFDGWYTDSACTQEFSFTTTITANTTLYAKWTEDNTQLVETIYKLQDSDFVTGTASEDIKINYYTIKSGAVMRDRSKTWTDPTDSTKTKSFTKSVKLDASGTLQFNAPEDGTLSIYVQNGSSNVATQAIHVGTVSNGKIGSTYETYTISGTSEVKDSNNTVIYAAGSPVCKVDIDLAKGDNIAIALVSGTIDLYLAEFKCYTASGDTSSYTVTFNSNGGSEVAAQSVNQNGKATEPTAPTKSGYTFGGWYTDSNCTQAFSFTTAITSNKTLYAKWTASSSSENAITMNGTAYATITAALSAIPTNSTDTYTIVLQPGTYLENGLNYNGKATIHIKGNTTAKYGSDVIIKGRGSNMASMRTRELLEIQGTANIILENITLQSDYERTSTSTDVQAEVLGTDTKGYTVAYNCAFKSHQDTLRTAGKAWFYGCYIEGDVDFIWMEQSGTVALYEKCEIVSVYDANASSHATYIAAPRMSISTKVGKGLVIYNSTVKESTEAAANGQKTLLARTPWTSGYYNQVAYINTTCSGIEAAVWKGSSISTSYAKTIIGWKMDSATATSLGYAGNDDIVDATTVTNEFSGRTTILNRLYNTENSKYEKDTDNYWDINALIETKGWTVDTDSSSAVLAGESVVDPIVYKLDGASDISALTIVGFKQDGDKTHYVGVNGNTITFTITGKCTIDVYGYYSGSATIEANTMSSSTMEFNNNSTNTEVKQTYEVNDASATTIVITATSTTYLTKIVVTPISE